MIKIISKYPLVKLETKVNIEYGTRITKKNAIGDELYPVYGGGGETFRCEKFNRENCYIVSRFGMSRDCVRFVKGKFFLNDSGLTIVSKDKSVKTEFINMYLYGFQENVYSLGRGSSQKNLDMDAFKDLQIPLPPLDVQQKIISECETLNNEYNRIRMSKEEYKNRITEIFDRLGVILKQED